MAEAHFTEKNKRSDITSTNFPPGVDAFKNNILIYIILSLVGAFVFFFAIFVLTNMYFKCLRKGTNDNEINVNQKQDHYKSLSFDAVEQECNLHQESVIHFNTDSAYLSPVDSGNQRSETSVDEIKIKRELLSHENSLQGFCQEKKSTQNEWNALPEQLLEHVYIEISEHDSNC